MKLSKIKLPLAALVAITLILALAVLLRYEQNREAKVVSDKHEATLISDLNRIDERTKPIDAELKVLEEQIENAKDLNTPLSAAFIESGIIKLNELTPLIKKAEDEANAIQYKYQPLTTEAEVRAQAGVSNIFKRTEALKKRLEAIYRRLADARNEANKSK